MKAPRRFPATPKRHVLGLDFGTLSGRALLVEADTGREVATAVHPYRHGVIETNLPGSKQRLPPDTALQHPADYLEVLSATIPEVLRAAKIRPEQVAGIGVDFTSCTMLPAAADGSPLCLSRRWQKNPHAWVKLWKHHAAQTEADDINKLATARDEPFLSALGGRYSSEWFFSKLLETVRTAPEVYDAAARFIEAGDWLVWQLCGTEQRSLSAAGFKAMRVCEDGKGGWTYPGRNFFRALHPKLEHVVTQKMSAPLLQPGARAGGLTPAMARLTGLAAGTPVAVANIDAHAAVPACGVTTPGRMVMIMGTSTCHLLLGSERHEIPGMCGVVEHGVVRGQWGYEAGQAGVGDLFAWYVNHGAPASVERAAQAAKVGVYEYLETEAARLRPGESGLLALDWWNGCRSVLMDSDLSGLLLGMTTATRPAEIYRALQEATAFGTRKIIETFTGAGVAIDELVACGGLAQRSPHLVQLYADVTGRPIRVAASEQTCALGAAMFAAVAAGVHSDLSAAATRMARMEKSIVRPRAAARPAYDRLYAEYTRLHDWFGRSPDGSMKVLKQLKAECLGTKQ